MHGEAGMEVWRVSIVTLHIYYMLYMLYMLLFHYYYFIDRHLVVVVQQHQPAEAQVAGERARLA